MIRNILQKIFKYLICVVFIMQMIPINAEETTKVIRVGWYNSEHFQEGEVDGEKSGYCYDYLQKIASYTNWEYEYVEGDWSDLVVALENGEIDFLGGVSITEERKQTMSFPESSMGNEQYYLCKKENDETIKANDLSSFNGKTIGLVENNLMSVYAEQWIKDNDLDINVKYYYGFSACNLALKIGEVDLVVRTLNGNEKLDGINSLLKVGSESYYLAINKQRNDLLTEMNDTLQTINSLDPSLLTDLYNDNYGLLLTDNNLTNEERDWLDSHDTISVGYLDNYLPYCDHDDGKSIGVLTDELKAIVEKLDIDIKINYISYKSYDEMIEAMGTDEIDVCFPVSEDLYRLEQDHIHATSSVISDSGTLFYRKNLKKGDIQSIAVNQNNVLQLNYTKKVYPNAKIMEYKNVDACLNAVLDGEVDGTIMDTMRIQYVTSNSKYDLLSYVQLSQSTEKCFGVKHGNSSLFMILNRGIRLVGSSYALDSTYKYIDEFYKYDLVHFIRENLVFVISFLVLVLGVIVILLINMIHKKESQRKTEENLRQAAQIANESKTNFLFNMSHDIRTPMNAVLGFTSIMENELDQPEKLKEHLDKLRISGEYLLNLINNVLEVARIDSGKETVEEKFVDILDVKYITILENDIQKKDLHVTKEVDIQHRYIYADVEKVREIVMNLLSNAVKYTPVGGSIQLILKELPCDKEGYATYTTIVQDTGIGMSKEFQKEIFESFSRERNTTESKIVGTGLGMSIVKRLMDLMGGTISVESELGKGSKFAATLTVRLVEDPEKVLSEIQKTKVEEKNLNGKRILVVEDNELNAEIAKTLLENAGAIVDIAEDGLKCIKVLEERESSYFDLILMDIQMPHLDGYETTKRIRQMSDSIKANIPIIAMTANAFEEDRQAAMKAGMNGHLSKPIDVDRLIETVSQYLS